MKRVLLLSAIAFAAASCNKSSVQQPAPATKAVSKTLATAGCTIADGVKYFTTTSGIVPSSIALDGSGNMYNAGYIYYYDSEFGTGTSPSAGSGYLQKTTLKGIQQWLMPIYNSGGTSIAPAGNIGYYTLPIIKTDATGNIYSVYSHVAGTPYADFPNYVLTKYDASGNQIWQQTQNLGENTQALGLNVDNSGNVYVCGNYNAATSVSGNTAPPFNLPLTGSGAFIQKFDGNGNSLSIHSANVTLNNNRFAIDKTGNVYMIDGSQGNGNANHFTKIKPDGTTAWQRSLGPDYPTNIVCDDNGNTLLWGTQNLPSGSPQFDAAEFSPSGFLLWRNNKVAPGISQATFDKQGNVYIIGYFSSAFDFDPSANNITLVPLSRADIYVQKFNQQGTLVWVKQRQVENSTVLTAVTDDTDLYIEGLTGNGVNYASAYTAYGLRMSLCL